MDGWGVEERREYLLRTCRADRNLQEIRPCVFLSRVGSWRRLDIVRDGQMVSLGFDCGKSIKWALEMLEAEAKAHALTWKTM